MTARDRRGRFTAERTTTTVTERLTAEIPWAPGWDDHPMQDASWWRQQRALQVERTAALVCAAADDGHNQLDEGTLRQAVTMLRALPGASCMEAEHGRSV